MAAILVGTADGLHAVGAGGAAELAGRSVEALAAGPDGPWAIADGAELWRRADGAWERLADLAGARGTCLLPLPDGSALVGTAKAHLLRWEGGRLERVASFDRAEGRERWYTPWGGPPDTRSLARAPDGALYAGVHVGGVLRSADGGASWDPTALDIDADVHQVATDLAGRVLAAAAIGLGVSEDGGGTWRLLAEGLHATYLRAVAVAGDAVLVSASTGPAGRRAAVYRLTGGGFRRCTEGLPEWFGGNIDTHCLVAAGDLAALGTAEGSVFVSRDGGGRWELLAEGLPPIACLALAG